MNFYHHLLKVARRTSLRFPCHLPNKEEESYSSTYLSGPFPSLNGKELGSESKICQRVKKHFIGLEPR
ncbi:unnamed protein product [Rhodiola kirilowii]